MSDHYQNSERPRKWLTFDPSINAGHVLTFVGFMVAGFSAYSTLDSRLVRLEEKAAASDMRAREQQEGVKEALSEIRADVKEVQRSLNDVNRNLVQRP